MGCNHSKPLDRKEFTKLCQNPKFTRILRREYYKVKQEEKLFGTFYACQLRQNRVNYGEVNRFCYDHNRVIIPVDYGSSDYINASYIDGWTKKRKFICTEAPLRKTMYQFWKMIWLHRTRIIVMLCETDELHEEQFYRYWDPYEGGVKVVKKFRIQTVKIMTRYNYKVTVLNVTDGTKELHEMIHISRLNCSKVLSVHESIEFIEFILNVRRIHRLFKKDLLRLNNPNYEPPIVVHCSSGTGISAVFCAMDISISEYHSNGTISLQSTAIKLRHQRYDSFFDYYYYHIYNMLMFRYLTLVLEERI